jgi:hypothetical protein
MAELTLLYGHPVPYSLTVQRRGRTLARLTRRHLAEIEQRLLDSCGAPAYVARVAGGYVWYVTPLASGVPAEPYRTSLRAIDVGFDLRAHPAMSTEIPRGDPAYRIETDAGEVCGAGDYVLRRLRALGYRAHWAL